MTCTLPDWMAPKKVALTVDLKEVNLADNWADKKVENLAALKVGQTGALQAEH